MRGGEIGARVYDIRYRHALDGLDYKHEFGRGARLVALPNGDALIRQDDGRRSWTDDDGQRFLINPGGRMARRGRDSKGRFLKGGRSKATRRRRRATARRPAAKTSSPRRRRRRSSSSSSTAAPRRSRRRYRRNSYASNPRFSVKGTMRAIQDGVIGGAEMLVGKAVARALPDMLNLPKQGNIGIAVQALIATGIAVIGDAFKLPRNHVAMVSAGAFAAPLETLIVAHDVPFLADALHPVTAAADMRGYLQPGAPMGRYLPAAGAGRVMAGGRSTMPMGT